MTGPDLRVIRKRLELTQAQLAAALDMSRDSIVKFESGKSRIPRVVELACERLAAVVMPPA